MAIPKIIFGDQSIPVPDGHDVDILRACPGCGRPLRLNLANDGHEVLIGVFHTSPECQWFVREDVATIFKRAGGEIERIRDKD